MADWVDFVQYKIFHFFIAVFSQVIHHQFDDLKMTFVSGQLEGSHTCVSLTI